MDRFEARGIGEVCRDQHERRHIAEVESSHLREKKAPFHRCILNEQRRDGVFPSIAAKHDGSVHLSRLMNPKTRDEIS